MSKKSKEAQGDNTQSAPKPEKPKKLKIPKAPRKSIDFSPAATAMFEIQRREATSNVISGLACILLGVIIVLVSIAKYIQNMKAVIYDEDKIFAYAWIAIAFTGICMGIIGVYEILKSFISMEQINEWAKNAESHTSPLQALHGKREVKESSTESVPSESFVPEYAETPPAAPDNSADDEGMFGFFGKSDSAAPAKKPQKPADKPRPPVMASPPKAKPLMEQKFDYGIHEYKKQTFADKFLAENKKDPFEQYRKDLGLEEEPKEQEFVQKPQFIRSAKGQKLEEQRESPAQVNNNSAFETGEGSLFESLSLSKGKSYDDNDDDGFFMGTTYSGSVQSAQKVQEQVQQDLEQVREQIQQVQQVQQELKQVQQQVQQAQKAVKLAQKSSDLNDNANEDDFALPVNNEPEEFMEDNNSQGVPFDPFEDEGYDDEQSFYSGTDYSENDDTEFEPSLISELEPEPSLISELEPEPMPVFADEQSFVKTSPKPAASAQPTIKPPPIPAVSAQPTIKPPPIPAASAQPTIKPPPIPAASAQPTIKPPPIPAASAQPTIKPPPIPQNMAGRAAPMPMYQGQMPQNPYMGYPQQMRPMGYSPQMAPVQNMYQPLPNLQPMQGMPPVQGYPNSPFGYAGSYVNNNEGSYNAAMPPYAVHPFKPAQSVAAPQMAGQEQSYNAAMPPYTVHPFKPAQGVAAPQMAGQEQSYNAAMPPYTVHPFKPAQGVAAPQMAGQEQSYNAAMPPYTVHPFKPAQGVAAPQMTDSDNNEQSYNAAMPPYTVHPFKPAKGVAAPQMAETDAPDKSYNAAMPPYTVHPFKSADPSQQPIQPQLSDDSDDYDLDSFLPNDDNNTEKNRDVKRQDNTNDKRDKPENDKAHGKNGSDNGKKSQLNQKIGEYKISLFEEISGTVAKASKVIKPEEKREAKRVEKPDDGKKNSAGGNDMALFNNKRESENKMSFSEKFLNRNGSKATEKKPGSNRPGANAPIVQNGTPAQRKFVDASEYDEWVCPGCGATNQEYVGVCSCGERKPRNAW